MKKSKTDSPTINQKFKLYLNKSQEGKLLYYQSVCKLLWNLALAQREDCWSKKQWHQNDFNKDLYSISEYSQSADLTRLKKEFPFFYEVPAGTLTNVLTMLDNSYRLFFSNLKKNPDRAGLPKYKRRKDSIGLLFKDWKVYPITSLNGNNYSRIGLPKIGTLRFRSHDEIKGRIKNCMIKKESDGWYIILAVEHAEKNINTSNSIIGIDLGVNSTVSTSDGEFYTIPEYIKTTEKRIEVLQRRMKKKKKGSSNSRKAYSRIAKYQAKVARQRDYFLKLIAHKLTTENKMIAIEDLSITNMTSSAKGTIEKPGKNVKAKAGLNRAILRNGWGKLVELLQVMGAENSCEIITVDPKYTSQTCPECGNVDSSNRNKLKFNCTKCGYENHADTVGAINIKHRALARKEPVEPTKKAVKKLTRTSGAVKQECATKLGKNLNKVKVLDGDGYTTPKNVV